MVFTQIHHKSCNIPAPQCMIIIVGHSTPLFILFCTQKSICETMEYYAAAQNDEIMQFSETLMELEDTMLSEISQKKKETQYDFTYLQYIE